MKKVLALVLAVFIFGGSALAFAWWDQLETDETITIGVGEGVTIGVDLSTQTTGNLVPSGVVMKTNDITEVELSFNVTLDSIELVSPLDLTVTVSNVQVGLGTDFAGLVNTVVVNPGTIQNDAVTVTITVTLDNPADEADYAAAYAAFATNNITFDVNFEATQQ